MVKNYEKFLEGKKKFPNIKRIDLDGFEVMVGKDAISNDYLTTILSNPEDLWFHAKGVPGSHVVLKYSDDINDDIINKVSMISFENSKLKNSGVVVYCKVKYVTKEDGMNCGQVRIDYNNSKEVKIKI